MKYRYAVIVAILALLVSQTAMAGFMDFFRVKRPATVLKPAQTITELAALRCNLTVAVPPMGMPGAQSLSTVDDVSGPPIYRTATGNIVRFDYQFTNCDPRPLTMTFHPNKDSRPATPQPWTHTLTGSPSGSVCIKWPWAHGSDDVYPYEAVSFQALPLSGADCYQQTGDDVCLVIAQTDINFSTAYNASYPLRVPEVVSCDTGPQVLQPTDLRMR